MSLAEVLLEEATKDGPALIRAVVAAFGADGVAKVHAILDAEYAAVDAAVDVLEADAIAKETTP